MSDLGWVAVVTLLVGAAWTLPALVRQGFRDPMRWTLFCSMLLLGVGNLISRPPVITLVDGWTTVGVAKLAYNVLILVGLCLMICFLRERPPTGWGALLRWEVLLCLACVGGLLWVTAGIAPPLRNHSLAVSSLRDEHVRAFYNLGNTYLLTGYAACAVLAWRQARKAVGVLQVALGTSSAGLAVLALSCVARLVWVDAVARHPDHALFDDQDVLALALAATIVVCVGMSMPAVHGLVAVLVEARGQRRRCRGLDELWHRLVEVHPDLVLNGWGHRRPLLATGYAVATYRRYVECRDGLLRLGALVPGTPESSVGAERAAQALDAALRGGPVGEPVVWRVHERYEDDVDALVLLSTALRDRKQSLMA